MTIGMAYDAPAAGRSSTCAPARSRSKIDLSFLRAKAVPLGGALLAICAFAAVSAYADLYRLRKAEKTLQQRLATETAGAVRRAEDRGRSARIERPRRPGRERLAAAEDVRVRHRCSRSTASIPPKDKITLDIDKLDIDSTKVDIAGTAKTAEEVDLLVTELKKIDCFNGGQPRRRPRPARTASRGSS